MLVFFFLMFLAMSCVSSNSENEEPILYYYGIEESERSLPTCGVRQACSAVVARYWRAPALVRLCRCARRQHCDTLAPRNKTIELNNRAHFQFCQSITDWPQCKDGNDHLTVETEYERLNPDELEELHHKNIQLVPPKVTFNCRCREPYHWKLSTRKDNLQTYRCASFPLCKAGEFCGNVNYDLDALYQSCLCPKHHMCVHNGGVTNNYISELLYEGKGWKAYCQRINNDYSYEDYNY